MKKSPWLRFCSIAGFITLLLFPAPSAAITLPLSFEGKIHASATFGSGSCEGEADLRITLEPNGTLYLDTNVDVEFWAPRQYTCKAGKRETWWTTTGNHDKSGTFSVSWSGRGFTVPITGTFSESQITGTGSASFPNSMSITHSFTLSNCPPDAKIPLPTGQQYVGAGEAPAVPVLGLNAAAMKPFAAGAVAGDPKGDATLRLGFCPFDGPVDIYLAYVDSVFQIYFLGADGMVKDAEHVQPWRTNVAGAVNQALGDFGGLFPDPGKLPKGANSFFVLVTRSGSPADFYLWGATADPSCPDPFPSLPEGPNFYYQPPVAVPLYSSDPAKMKPLALGPAAIGGKTAVVYADFCNFGYVDVHFMVYCADDPTGFYFLNFNGKEREEAAKEDFIEGIAPADFTGFPAPFIRNKLLDEDKETPEVFFVGPVTALPKPVCLYLVAIAPPNSTNPATQYHAWFTVVDFDIGVAMLDYWWNGLHPPASANKEARTERAVRAVTDMISRKR